MMLHWSNNPSSLVLESTDSLHQDSVWTTDAQIPESYENQNFVALGEVVGSRYFRLRSLTPNPGPFRIEMERFLFTLAWSASDPNFVLESTESLGSNSLWSLFPFPPKLGHGTFSVGVNPYGKGAYYRLRALPRDPIQLADALSQQAITSLDGSAASVCGLHLLH